MDKYTDEKLDDMFYELEDAVNKLKVKFAKLTDQLETASYKSVGKCNKVTIGKNTAREGDVVGIFKIESEDPFKTS